MDVIRVKEAAKQIGVSEQTIRKLEQRHIIPTARAYNGHRIFSPEDVDRIKAILFPTEREVRS